MKILLECYACDPNKGSENYNGWRWTRSLAEAGHQVDLLTCEAGADSTRATLAELALNSVNLHILPRNKALWKLPKGIYLDYARWLSRCGSLAETIKDIDIAHHVTLGNVAFGTRIWRSRAPTILGPCGGGQIMHPVLQSFLPEEQSFEKARSTLVKAANRFAVLPGARIDKVHVLGSNPETVELAKARGALSAQLFPDPVLDDRDLRPEYPERPPTDTVTILWVGRMLPRKGIELAIRAFARTKGNAILKIIGDGPRKEAAELLTAQLGLQARIQFVGRLPRNEVSDQMRKADIFFFASLRDSMPAQFLEAMASGLPIVTLNVYGNPVLIPDTAGILVPIKDPDQVVSDLASALDFLTASRETREKMGHASWRESQRFTMDKKVDEMTAIYRRALDSSKHASAL